jgi:hypothetical protein
MEGATIALAILGFTVGVLFRLKVLLSIGTLLLTVSIIFSLVSGFTFWHAALTIIVVQSILQGSYFVGLVVRAMLGAAERPRHVL